MKVGILGSGNVGQVLGRGFAALRHEVKLGSRDPEQDKIKEWINKTGNNVSSGKFEEVASFGDLIVFAVLGTAVEDVIKLANPDNFDNKIVIDTTNPLDLSQGTPPKLFVGLNDSLGEKIQRLLPKSKVVKAFNAIGNAHMFKPDFSGGPPDMFICGNDEEAKQEVTKILNSFGWSVIDIGGIKESRLLEPLAMLWITYAFKTNTWNHAFKLLKK